jgi:hypothetical protein
LEPRNNPLGADKFAAKAHFFRLNFQAFGRAYEESFPIVPAAITQKIETPSKLIASN